jgi:hypothetical protein
MPLPVLVDSESATKKIAAVRHDATDAPAIFEVQGGSYSFHDTRR